MDRLITALSAAADPTRLRLLALAARGAFCVNDFCDILGQSQPRLSAHLPLLNEAGLLERTREGANAWYVLAQGEPGALARDLLRRADPEDPTLAADRRALPACWPSAPAKPRKNSAAPAPTGTKCAHSICPPRT
ncbi:MAG: metalloregulator ArsR/SmtB family transcription factor [Rhodospirillales bacterium]